MASIKKREVMNFISKLVNSLSAKEKKRFLKQILDEKELPISIFRTKNISGLEAIVVYLKDVKNKEVKEISDILNRKKSTIYNTYYHAKKKLKGKLDCSDYFVTVPLSNFSNRKFAILESIVFYLKHDKKFSLTKIASLLKRKYSTVNTAYYRYKQKNNGKK